MTDRTQRMSKAVPAALVLSLAAALLGGCSTRRDVRRCVDEFGNVLPDAQCGTTGSRMFLGRRITPRWAYGGTVSGNRVSSFRTQPLSGADVVDAKGNTISRGGFGKTGSSRSFFGG